MGKTRHGRHLVDHHRPHRRLAGQCHLGGRGGGLLYNLAVGLVGAIVGGLIFDSLHIFPVGFVGALVSATVGAVVFLLIWRAIKRA